MHEAPAWHTVWKEISEAIERAVSKFNGSGDSSFTTSRTGRVVKSPNEVHLGIQVVPKRGPVEPLVVQIDPRTQVIQFDGTIAYPGVPRRSFFTISPGGLVVLKEHVVGEPKPSTEPMTPEQFSKFVLATIVQKSR
jgi:hypothetical protein